MARTKKKELTPEEMLEQEKERCLSTLEREYELTHAPVPPTYTFEVGERVLYGAMVQAVVEKVLKNNTVYLLKCIAHAENYGHPYDYETYRIAPWHQVRPIRNHNTEPEFAKNQDVRLYFNNTSVESLIHKMYSFGIDMQPDYQRGHVWNDEDRHALIQSIFENIDIGKFVFVRLDNDEWRKRDVGYEVLDGKQRMSTILAFYENRFPYNGKYFNDLSAGDKRIFKNHSVVYAEIADATKQDVYRYFLMLNRAGRAVDKAQLDKVEAMLSNNS